MKKLWSLLALGGALAAPTAPAEEIFVCVAIGLNVFTGDNNTFEGFGSSEDQARTAALLACQRRSYASCQIAHCGRTTTEPSEPGTLLEF